MRRQAQQVGGPACSTGSPMSPTAVGATEPDPARLEEDPELAAYNARLAELAAKGPKTWRTRDQVVVRRAQ